MIRHWLEMALIVGLLVLSLAEAHFGHFDRASYWLFWAAFVDFDDWSHRPKCQDAPGA
jgi:hypothetical protein